MFTFANQAGLDMLETTLVALQDIMLDKILDEAGRKVLCSEFSKIMHQVITRTYFNSIVGFSYAQRGDMRMTNTKPYLALLGGSDL